MSSQGHTQFSTRRDGFFSLNKKNIYCIAAFLLLWAGSNVAYHFHRCDQTCHCSRGSHSPAGKFANEIPVDSIQAETGLSP